MNTANELTKLKRFNKVMGKFVKLLNDLDNKLRKEGSNEVPKKK